MDNQAITITANATIGGVPVFKMTIELPYGVDGLDGKLQGQATDTPMRVKENPELASYSVFESAGFRKLSGKNGKSMWVRPEAPAFFSNSDGVWLDAEQPTPHPISVDWIRGNTQ